MSFARRAQSDDVTLLAGSRSRERLRLWERQLDAT